MRRVGASLDVALVTLPPRGIGATLDVTVVASFNVGLLTLPARRVRASFDRVVFALPERGVGAGLDVGFLALPARRVVALDFGLLTLPGGRVVAGFDGSIALCGARQHPGRVTAACQKKLTLISILTGPEPRMARVSRETGTGAARAVWKRARAPRMTVKVFIVMVFGGGMNL